MITDFHFLRPWWLLTLIPALLIVWGIHRRSSAGFPWQGIVADHLVPYLVRGAQEKHRQGPVLLLLAGVITVIIVLAGPSWKREPSPFADDVAALAIVVKVTPSMETEDIAPNRLERSVQKVQDLLARRGGAKTALIAYSGTAHVVMPATTDAGIINSFAAALAPAVMPEEGDAAAEALKLADKSLADAGGGSILWITDGVSSDEVAAVSAWRSKTRTPVRILAPVSGEGELRALRSSAETDHADLIPLAADDSDIDQLARASRFGSVTGGGEDARWRDSGYALVPLLALLMLPFFRKGWMPALAART